MFLYMNKLFQSPRFSTFFFIINTSNVADNNRSYHFDGRIPALR